MNPMTKKPYANLDNIDHAPITVTVIDNSKWFMRAAFALLIVGIRFLCCG